MRQRAATLLVLAMVGGFAPDDTAWLADDGNRRTQQWVAERNAEAERQFQVAATMDANPEPPVAQFQGDRLLMLRGGQLSTASLRSLIAGSPQWRAAAVVPADPSLPRGRSALASVDCLPPDYQRCLLLFEATQGRQLLREVDLQTGAAPDRFALGPLPIAASWYDADRLLIATDVGAGSLGAAGTPRLVKLWQRGEPVTDARTVLAAEPASRAVAPAISVSPGGLFHIVRQWDGFANESVYHLGWEQNLVRAQLPDGARFLGFFQGRGLAVIAHPWRLDTGVLPAGSLIAYPMAPLMGPQRLMRIELALTPQPGETVRDVRAGRDTLFVHLQRSDGARLVALRKGAPAWRAEPLLRSGAGEAMRLIAASDLADMALVQVGATLQLVGRGRTRVVERLDQPQLDWRTTAAANGQVSSVQVGPRGGGVAAPRLLVDLVGPGAPLPATWSQLSPLARAHVARGGRYAALPLAALDARSVTQVLAATAGSPALAVTATGAAALPLLEWAGDSPGTAPRLVLVDPALFPEVAVRSGDARALATRLTSPGAINFAALPPLLVLAGPDRAAHPVHGRMLVQAMRALGRPAIYSEGSQSSYQAALGALYLALNDKGPDIADGRTR